MTLFKKSLFALAFIALLSSQVFSQSVKMGIEGGLNFSNPSFTPNLQASSRTGMVVGGFAEFKVSPIVSIKPGVRYVMKGFTLPGIAGPVTFKTNYIEIPALLKITFPLQQVKPYIEAGPSLSLNVSANSEAAGLNQLQETDESRTFESTEFGLYFGSGLDFRVGSNIEMFTGIGYSLGLSNSLNSLTVTNVNSKNNGFRITSGVKFDL
jgi:hypothetical protein